MQGLVRHLALVAIAESTTLMADDLWGRCYLAKSIMLPIDIAAARCTGQARRVSQGVAVRYAASSLAYGLRLVT